MAKQRRGHQTVNATVFLTPSIKPLYQRSSHGLWSFDVREPLVMCKCASLTFDWY